MTFLDHLVVLVLALLLPLWSSLSHARFRSALGEGDSTVRLQAYAGTLALMAALSVGVGWLWAREDRGLAALGLVGEVGAGLLAGLGIVAVMLGVFARRALRVARDPDAARDMIEELRGSPGTEVLPTRDAELAAFLPVVVLGAGLGEELLYRGYLMWYFGEAAGVAGAVALSSLVFGLGHAYQGAGGVLRAALAGAVLAVTYRVTGSLWIPVILHAVNDLNAALSLWLAAPEWPAPADIMLDDGG